MMDNIWSAPPMCLYFYRNLSLRESNDEISGIIWFIGKFISFCIKVLPYNKLMNIVQFKKNIMKPMHRPNFLIVFNSI